MGIPKKNLYHFAFLMTGDREDADRFTSDFLETANLDDALDDARFDTLIGAFARDLTDKLGRAATTSFAILDNILRTEITRPLDPDHQEVRGSAERVRVMLWELKRTCLARVLCGLPPSVRVAFVLTVVFGYSPAAAARLLFIRESAYRVRLTRARKRVGDFLSPRCEHMDPKNPCTCEGRLVIALDHAFVRFPPHLKDTPAGDHDTSHTGTDVELLYRELPGIEPAADRDSFGEATC